MTDLQIKQTIQNATGITKLMVSEMGPNLSAVPTPRRCVIINVGPLEVDLDNAARGLEQTRAIVDAVLGSLVQVPSLEGCRLGISVFAMPGGQAFRALAGSHEVTADSRPPYRLEGAYSNIRTFRVLLGN